MTDQKEDPLRNGERQVAETIDGIRNDHVARYVWAEALMVRRIAELGGGSVVDLGCGIGYGSQYMADRGWRVTGIDASQPALDFAGLNYNDPANPPYYVTADLDDLDNLADVMPSNDQHTPWNYATAFEIIEHLENPRGMLTALPCKELFCSVPNETYFPFKGPGHPDGYRFHKTHYTEEEFRALLTLSGWHVRSMRHQVGPESAVGNVPGRTLVAHCERVKPIRGKRIAILGLGPSLVEYTELVKRLGGPYARYDEVWGINAAGGVFACDRVFHMDDVRIQKARAEMMPDSNIAVMYDWLPKHPGPIYTSHIPDDWPGDNLVRYPVERVIHDLGMAYFNSTIAYAVALAIHERAFQIAIYGADFTYPNAHKAERGRACVEFWLSMARDRGIVVNVPGSSTIFDAMMGLDESFYGFRDGYEISIDNRNTVHFTPRDELPTAEEIEDRYDHAQHPNQHVRVMPKEPDKP